MVILSDSLRLGKSNMMFSADRLYEIKVYQILVSLSNTIVKWYLKYPMLTIMDYFPSFILVLCD